MRTTRKKRCGRNTAMLLTGILLFLGLAACQQTPEGKTVIQKDQEQLLMTADSLEDKRITVKEQVQAPEKVQLCFSDSANKRNVTVDAEIILPEVEQIPIVQVEGRKFNQKDVDAWIDYFFEGDVLYSISSVSNYTKEEYQEMQLQYKKELADKEAQLASGDQNQEEELNIQIEELRSLIESLDGYIESAPETNEWIQADSTIQDGPGAHMKSVEIAAVNLLRGGYKYYHYFESDYTDDDLTSRMYYGDRGDKYISGYSPASILSEDEDNLQYAELPDLEMSREEAIAYGNEVVKALDLDGNLGLTACQEGVIDYEGWEMSNRVKVWNLTYELEYEGIAAPYCESAIGVSLAESRVPWSYKELTLMIDDQGIVQADFNGPCEVKERLVENCKLLPYESIMEIFQKMMLLGEGWFGDAEVLAGDAQVTRIQLGYARITSRNQVGVGMLVPAWFFYGERSVVLEGYTQSLGGGGEVGLMVINAIDGSIINLDNGY